ncbi:uncharacterized protein LOC112637324 [Camponotus floridanus]|uniref:uncharacterized protein LOC112637324 n=1 Tax=Camponotus floridanus TaxID=104421 RepID=UPI000DC674C9|nr:uncharacterized protein LOC112637324 [Camponotus floridanus]
MLIDAKICLDSTLRIRGIRVHRANMELQLLEGLHENLQTNLSLNQDLLWNLDLSHSNFDTICSIANTCKFKKKLTVDGASKVIILLLPNYHASVFHKNKVGNLMKSLKEKGFMSQITTICTGVRLD